MFKNQKFLKGLVDEDTILLNDNLKLAFYGRSNVGKSSVINTILGTKNLVRSSSKPGKTTEINLFEAENLENKKKYFFLDLPGYGYAKISKKEREKLRELILNFLLSWKIEKRLNFLILDIRRGLTDFDKQILEILKDLQKNKNEDYLIILNKSDKINQKEKNKIKKEFEGLKENFILFSAFKKKGLEDLNNFLKNYE